MITCIEITIPPNSLNRYRKTIATINLHDGVNIVTRGHDDMSHSYIVTMNAIIKKLSKEEIQVYEPYSLGRYTIPTSDILDISTSRYETVSASMHPVRPIPIAKRSRMWKALYMDDKASDKYTSNSLSDSYSEVFEVSRNPYLDPVIFEGREIALLVDIDSKYGYISDDDASKMIVRDIPNPVLIFDKNLEPKLISSKDEILL